VRGPEGQAPIPTHHGRETLRSVRPHSRHLPAATIKPSLGCPEFFGRAHECADLFAALERLVEELGLLALPGGVAGEEKAPARFNPSLSQPMPPYLQGLPGGPDSVRRSADALDPAMNDRARCRGGGIADGLDMLVTWLSRAWVSPTTSKRAATGPQFANSATDFRNTEARSLIIYR